MDFGMLLKLWVVCFLLFGGMSKIFCWYVKIMYILFFGGMSV